MFFSTSSQVGYDIYSETDLLALDSSPHSLAVSVAPPPAFLQQQQLEASQTKLAVLLPTPLTPPQAVVLPTPLTLPQAIVLPTPLTPPQAMVLPTPLTPPQASGDTALSYTSTRDGQGGYSFG